MRRAQLSLPAVAIALLGIAGLTAPRGSVAQELDPKDLEHRVDYAYFTEGDGALRNLIRESRTTLAKGAASEETRYVLAFASYRLGSLLAAKDPARAASAMSDCIDDLDETLEANESFAEGYALQSACLGQLAGLRPLTAMVNGPKSATRMERALKLAPQNPRIVLLDALSDYERPKAFGGDKTRALGKLKRAAGLFDESVQGATTMPGWGHADAQAFLGRSLLEAGDTLGARNALERALIIAPEYAAAKRLLARVTATR